MTGRKSFGNFNASIEISTKELETAAKNAALEANEAKERISEKEMTERFGTLVQGGAQKKSPKKSKKKRQTDEMSEESPSRTPKKKKKSNATLSQEFEIGPSSRFSGISEEGTDKVFMRPTEWWEYYITQYIHLFMFSKTVSYLWKIVK